MQLPIVAQTALLLAASNVFMTFAWYAHLRNLNEKPWWIAAFLSWGIALGRKPAASARPTASATRSCPSGN